MDPYNEQRLREEVIYLHTLWHLGPPRAPNPNPSPTSNTSKHLRLSKPKQFKKQKKQKPKQLPPASDLEWPCKEPSENPPSSGWPAPLTPTTRLPTAEELARLSANLAHEKALKATQKFLSELDDDEGLGSSDEDELMDKDGYQEHKFFIKMFDEDAELRGYFEKNWKSGEFCCLVCSGIGNKVRKRFRNCVALVQHSATISKAKKTQAHRAYGQVICKVLGWDMDKLPASAVHLASSGESKGNAEVAVEGSNVLNQMLGLANVNSGELEMKEVPNVGQEEELCNSFIPGTSSDVGDSTMLSVGNAEVVMEDLSLLNQISGSDNVNDGELVIKDVFCAGGEEELHKFGIPGSSSVGIPGISEVADANKCMENLSNVVLSVAGVKTEGEVNCLCTNLAKTLLENEMKNDHNEIIVPNGLNNNNKNQNQ